VVRFILPEEIVAYIGGKERRFITDKMVLADLEGAKFACFDGESCSAYLASDYIAEAE